MSPVLTGVLADYNRRGEWHDFTIAGKRVGTKRLDVAEKAMPLLGQQVQADVFEKASKNINPNTQQPYIDRYLETITPATVVQAPGEALPPTSPFSQPTPAEPNIPMEVLTQVDPSIEFGAPAGTAPLVPPSDDRELKIMRQTATKVAVQLLAYASKENQKPENLIALADWLVNYYRFGSSKETYAGD